MLIFGEDTVVAGRLLHSGCKVDEVAEARAYHSHAHSWIEEFGRYFDIGVLPSAMVRTALKLLGSRLGTMEAQLPLGLKRRLSSQPGFWVSG